MTMKKPESRGEDEKGSRGGIRFICSPLSNGLLISLYVRRHAHITEYRRCTEGTAVETELALRDLTQISIRN